MWKQLPDELVTAAWNNRDVYVAGQDLVLGESFLKFDKNPMTVSLLDSAEYFPSVDQHFALYCSGHSFAMNRFSETTLV